MNKKKYTLRYLPLFGKDLTEAVNYIAVTLQDPITAERLVDEVEASIEKRLEMPKAFAPYPSTKPRKYPYYRINVRNYAVFYVVIGNVMEVRRFLYSKRNIDELL
ncbi:MAG: type II toxin-antitoxin system RelE/ParE family toxin [Oscillospiraceae bacterium]|nr:type II toxin-antitoxin system RelE/ParE family toxin [Oscillospiraceae bacterium]